MIENANNGEKYAPLKLYLNDTRTCMKMSASKISFSRKGKFLGLLSIRF